MLLLSIQREANHDSYIIGKGHEQQAANMQQANLAPTKNGKGQQEGDYLKITPPLAAPLCRIAAVRCRSSLAGPARAAVVVLT